MVLETNIIEDSESTMTQSIKEPTNQLSRDGSRLTLPNGIVGFPEFKHVEVVYKEDELPFMHLREINEDGLEFIVLEPYGHFPGYDVEISKEDLEQLGIEKAEDVHLMNIVAVDPNTGNATINLAAPLVFNKNTLEGKQVIIKNVQHFSATHSLNAEEEKE